MTNAFDIPIFTEAYLRPLFCKAIGPFRWMALSGEESDIARIDDLVLELFPTTRSSPTGSRWRGSMCPSRAYPPASPGSAMGSAHALRSPSMSWSHQAR